LPLHCAICTQSAGGPAAGTAAAASAAGASASATHAPPTRARDRGASVATSRTRSTTSSTATAAVAVNPVRPQLLRTTVLSRSLTRAVARSTACGVGMARSWPPLSSHRNSATVRLIHRGRRRQGGVPASGRPCAPSPPPSTRTTTTIRRTTTRTKTRTTTTLRATAATRSARPTAATRRRRRRSHSSGAARAAAGWPSMALTPEAPAPATPPAAVAASVLPRAIARRRRRPCSPARALPACALSVCAPRQRRCGVRAARRLTMSWMLTARLDHRTGTLVRTVYRVPAWARWLGARRCWQLGPGRGGRRGRRR